MTVDRDQALRDLTRVATIYLMAVDAPDLLQDGQTAEDVRVELLEALDQAERALDQIDSTPGPRLAERRRSAQARRRRR
ncbi:hypothetical protein GKE82_26000 [Conexibacter sp. W3-3-2]|uniref:hypothetical protein n=1 Tax=Conexibacter sp. W3-3-2 TaxID=2675227 RepID=UPI0012BA2650|nr:hypothetical protein [Conexibacter sp. W3-3-2]MTD47658.1 hypothetical protein [Conexibacter sp. W3-3-2]